MNQPEQFAHAVSLDLTTALQVGALTNTIFHTKKLRPGGVEEVIQVTC